MAHAVEMRGISKRFGGLVAVNDVSFAVTKGTIHALVGENGAGKSTLMNILCGKFTHASYGGSIFVDEKEVKLSSPRDATRAGITMVHQELALIPELSVAENMFLGNQPMKNGIVDWKAMYSGAKRELEALSLAIDPKMKIKYLSVGQQQLVEICKAVMLGGKVMILDEPTSPLSDREIEFLFSLLRKLRGNGITIIYISHRLEEIFALTDFVSVMRDGQMVVTSKTTGVDHRKLVSYMIGRELKDFYPTRQNHISDVALEIKSFSVKHPVQIKNIVEDVSMSFRQGEIVGISGLLGAGRTELMSAVIGSYTCPGSGEILLAGKPVRIKSARQAVKLGIGFVTESRKENGLILDQSIRVNISLASLDRIKKAGMLNRRKENALVKEHMKKLRIKAAGLSSAVSSLSGGNQQKVVLGKWLATGPKILIMDEPTRGVDVGAKYEIYSIMKDLAANGVCIIMISSDLPEIIGMSDRVYVMYEGRLAKELPKEELSQDNIMRYACGGERQ